MNEQPASDYFTAREQSRLQKHTRRGGDLMAHPRIMKTALVLLVLSAVVMAIQTTRSVVRFVSAEGSEMAMTESMAAACVAATVTLCLMGLFFWLRGRIADNQIIIKLHRQVQALQEARGAE